MEDLKCIYRPGENREKSDMTHKKCQISEISLKDNNSQRICQSIIQQLEPPIDHTMKKSDHNLQPVRISHILQRVKTVINQPKETLNSQELSKQLNNSHQPKSPDHGKRSEQKFYTTKDHHKLGNVNEQCSDTTDDFKEMNYVDNQGQTISHSFSDNQQSGITTVEDNMHQPSHDLNLNHLKSELSSEFSDEGRYTSCSSHDVFTSLNQEDSESCYAESISTSQEDYESNSGESISSTQDDFGIPSTFQVVNCSQVQIGSTINFNGPVSVTESCEQNLPLPSMLSNAQVNLLDGSVAEVGSKINYNGPVNITKIVNVNSINYEEFDSLSIHDQIEFPDNSSDVAVSPRTAVKLINRRMWLAQPPLGPAERLQHPVSYVVILHTATEQCLKQSECVFMTRHIQNFHIEGNGWWDIGYSFLVGGDGNVYEGRGWDKVGAFAKGYNHISIGIALIGTFTMVLPSESQLRTLDYWIEEGVRLGNISPDYKILTHHQLSGTTSPGTAFIELIKTWPRWLDVPPST